MKEGRGVTWSGDGGEKEKGEKVCVCVHVSLCPR